MRTNPAKAIIATILITIFIIVTVISLVFFFKEPEETKDSKKSQNNIEIILTAGKEASDYAVF
ncbi:MAG: hypothetical protein IJV15_13875 [Lachnospiraceae bacterium]|nr:hypothetical protein [Lachnospiraceae bacterium]